MPETMMLTRRALLGTTTLAATAALLGPAVWRAAIGAAAAKPPIAMFKNPGCECCDGYATYLREHGFTVTVKETDKLASISTKAGVPAEMQGCHTAFVGGYVVEGHVPVEAVENLLTDQPAIKAIALPGMPTGSPGMPGAKSEPFTIYAIDQDGKTSTFMKI